MENNDILTEMQPHIARLTFTIDLLYTPTHAVLNYRALSGNNAKTDVNLYAKFNSDWFPEHFYQQKALIYTGLLNQLFLGFFKPISQRYLNLQGQELINVEHKHEMMSTVYTHIQPSSPTFK